MIISKIIAMVPYISAKKEFIYRKSVLFSSRVKVPSDYDYSFSNGSRGEFIPDPFHHQ